MLKGVVGQYFVKDCSHKRDTITPEVIFSFNGRRLVTSLILLIATIILSILLIVNFDYIIFTEASVNTSSQASLTSTTPRQLSVLSISTATTLSSIPPKEANITTTNSSFISKQPGIIESPRLDTIQIDSRSTNDSRPTGDTGQNNNSLIVVLAKIKSTEGNIVERVDNTSASTTPDESIGGLETANNNQISGNNILGNDLSISQLSGSGMNSGKSETVAKDEKKSGDHCPAPTPDRNSVSNNETSKYFDIDYAIKTFEDSMVDKDAISLHHYLNGFKELMK